MEWEINPDQRSTNNQPEPITPQSIPPEPEQITAEPIQEEPICKLPGFGYFFGKTFSVYKNNFWTFLFISAIPFVISSLLAYFSIINFTTKPSFSSLILLIPVYLILMIISLWSSLSLLYAVKERENGISIGGALAKGWSNLGSGIWVSILTFVIVAAGFILFIIPGIIFSIWFLLALYVLVDENKKGMSALKRSKELISGYLTAFWGRTILFSLIFSIILFLFSFIIRFFSAFLPILDRVTTIVNIIATPLFVIFSFLVYENIKKAKEGGCKKSPREIRYTLIILLLFLPILGILAAIALVNLNSAKQKSNNINIESSMWQLQMGVQLYASDKPEFDYSGANCSLPDLIQQCDAIKSLVGEDLVIKTSQTNYCLYVKLPSGKYYCLDSFSFGHETNIFPGSFRYCDDITFNCP